MSRQPAEAKTSDTEEVTLHYDSQAECGANALGRTSGVEPYDISRSRQTTDSNRFLMADKMAPASPLNSSGYSSLATRRRVQLTLSSLLLSICLIAAFISLLRVDWAGSLGGVLSIVYRIVVLLPAMSAGSMVIVKRPWTTEHDGHRANRCFLVLLILYCVCNIAALRFATSLRVGHSLQMLDAGYLIIVLPLSIAGLGFVITYGTSLKPDPLVLTCFVLTLVTASVINFGLWFAAVAAV